MSKACSVVVVFVAVGLVGVMSAQADSLSDRLAKTQGATMEMQVACGKLDKANCAEVLPRIAEQAATSGLTIKPLESEGSYESSTGVCVGAAEGAIVQRDAADLRGRQADCVGKFESVGQPLYPYYGFLVISANAPYDTLEKLVGHTPEGKTLNVAVGADGSGGAVTMNYILRANPDWKRVITPRNYGLETALQRIKDGNLDGFFVMDAPGSPLVDQIANAKDAKGKAIFQFADVRPGSAFYDLKDWAGHRMFQEAIVIPGTFRSTKSVSVDAVMIVSNAFREDRQRGGPKVVETLAGAIDRASAAILADTKTPRGWTPAAAQR